MELRKCYRPLAKHAVTLFSLLSSLCNIQHEYRFSLGYFVSIFRSAVGRDAEPCKEKLEYESDDDANKEDVLKSESKTKVAITVIDEDGTMLPAVVKGSFTLMKKVFVLWTVGLKSFWQAQFVW